MAYETKNNPLNGIQVEIPNRCRSRSHTEEVLLYGACPTCKNVFAAKLEEKYMKAFGKKVEVENESSEYPAV